MKKNNERTDFQERDTAEVLNNFFSNIIDKFNIVDYSYCDPFVNKVIQS